MVHPLVILFSTALAVRTFDSGCITIPYAML
jgi:hypothetical protein